MGNKTNIIYLFTMIIYASLDKILKKSKFYTGAQEVGLGFFSLGRVLRI